MNGKRWSLRYDFCAGPAGETLVYLRVWSTNRQHLHWVRLGPGEDVDRLRLAAYIRDARRALALIPPR